ncbi:MAG TPA: MauE/DoxX family redox-associated membrane protein [Gaiellales bacterium]|jgi:uncharacterized membrane protein YphA (DoxX/SURF4 family)|nr:MauE/DoxX family redox-associated membrane protein [Gaiellales bacterium]
MPDIARRRDLLGLAARLAAGGIWLAAGVAKALDFDSFRVQIEGYDVLPHAAVSWVAYGLPLLEIALGAYLILGLLVRPAAWLSLGLLVVFIAAQAQAWARGLAIDCGCFGSVDVQRVGAGTIIRDLLLSIPTLVVLTVGGGRYGLDSLLHRPLPADQHGHAGAVGADPGHDHLG